MKLLIHSTNGHTEVLVEEGTLVDGMLPEQFFAKALQEGKWAFGVKEGGRQEMVLTWQDAQQYKEIHISGRTVGG